jgi:hypothetical protein
MIGTRPKSAWIWVAVAAISWASLARAQSGIETARAYANPFIAFFAGSQVADSGASTSAQRAASPSQFGSAGIGLDLLPVFFVGLISPLGVLSSGSTLSLGRVLPAPSLPGLFQRPPPLLFS